MCPEAALVLWLLGGLAALAPPSEPLPPLTAYVSRVDGPASAEAPGGLLLELRPGRVLPGDSRLSVPPGSGVVLVCSNERRALVGGSASLVTEVACGQGQPVLPGTYRALARGDRDLALERSGEVRHRILQVNTRGSEEDDPRVPVLLAPRETAVRDPRPEIRWTRVAGAEEYVLELVGTAPWREQLRAEDVPCRTVEHPPGRLDVCAMPWPREAPDLTAGETVFLTVGARTGIVTPLRAAEERSLRLLPEASAARIEAGLAAVREAARPGAEEALRAAALLAGHGLRGEASALLRESLVEEPSAAAFLLLGSLDLERHLPRAAARSFEEALRLAADHQALTQEAREGIALARRLLGDEP